MGVAATSRFHYSYEDDIEESIEAALCMFGAQIEQGAKWRPSVPLLVVGAICGLIGATAGNTAPGKLVGFLLPIVVAALLMISSKETRVLSARKQIELCLRKSYTDKICHIHNLAIDDSGLVETCPCGTDTRKWEAIRRWHETERTIALEAQNKALYTIPKRVVPREELQPLRDLISSHVLPTHI